MSFSRESDLWTSSGPNYKSPHHPVNYSLMFGYYTRCSYMIDNVILLMNGALQKKSVKEVLAKCHPLGRFTEMEAVNIAETTSDLFKAVLVETPLGMETYFLFLFVFLLYFNFLTHFTHQSQLPFLSLLLLPHPAFPYRLL